LHRSFPAATAAAAPPTALSPADRQAAVAAAVATAGQRPG